MFTIEDKKKELAESIEHETSYLIHSDYVSNKEELDKLVFEIFILCQSNLETTKKGLCGLVRDCMCEKVDGVIKVIDLSHYCDLLMRQHYTELNNKLAPHLYWWHLDDKESRAEFLDSLINNIKQQS